MAFLSLASIAALTAAPFASLDLCADEYLLMFAPAERIASVSHLAKQAEETPLAPSARAIPANDGSLETLAGRGIGIAFTTRQLDQVREKLARRMGIRVIALSHAASPDDVAANVRTVAQLTGGLGKAEPWLRRYRKIKARPAKQRQHFWVSGSGASPGAGVAGWLSLAGIRLAPMRSGLGRIEQLAATPHPLIVSTYREGQYSRNGEWLSHPLVEAKVKAARKVDGRPFTCAGPLMLDLVEGLRRP